ncbi:MAG: SUMF1/EgtB/PvdO family nonheme iron enzyme [Byssovorax sp.]
MSLPPPAAKNTAAPTPIPPRASPRRRVVLVTVALTAVALIVGVVVFASSRAEPPARCAAGMIALGPRCCGAGQRLDGDRCAGAPRACATGMRVTGAGCLRVTFPIPIAGGVLRVGPGDWEAQGVVTPYETAVAPFAIDAVEVTEQRWTSCVIAGACAPLPLSGEPGRAVNNVNATEAGAFCRWSQGSLPTRDQLTYAAAGRAGRRYAWGDTGAVCRRAAWGLVDGPCGQGARGPELAGSHPDGASPEGVLDLAGNVAEWTLPTGPAARETEVRGGCFADSAAGSLRTWQRRVVSIDTRSPEIGLRCVYQVLP